MHRLRLAETTGLVLVLIPILCSRVLLGDNLLRVPGKLVKKIDAIIKSNFHCLYILLPPGSEINYCGYI